jgi:DNA-binding NarL/FixJ family response regulator
MLGEEAFVTAWTNGRTMPLARVVEMALAGERATSLPAANRRDRGTPPHGLTARELEVLRLVASGRSNREIATDLVLSVRTVEKHIASIYAKIGARGRADAATYALRHQLVEPVTLHG